MLKPFYNEVTVQAGGETLRLVINFRTIDATETLLKPKSYDEILGEVTGDKPPLGLISKVLWGMLREHHPEVTIDQTTSLLFGETGTTVGLALNQLLVAAFNTAEEPKAKGQNPPKRRGASKLS